MNFTCPVCTYDKLDAPPRHYEICPCCGTEFGNDDEQFTYGQLRTQWLLNGAGWFFREPPVGWNPWIQLIRGGYPEAVPKFANSFVIEGNSTLSMNRQCEYLGARGFLEPVGAFR